MALLACRSPPGLSRSRLLILPLVAGIGRPRRASPRRLRSGSVRRCRRRRRAGSRRCRRRRRRCSTARCGRFDERFELRVERGELGVEGLDAAGQDHRRGLGRVHGPDHRRRGRSLAASLTSCVASVPEPGAELVGCGEHQMAELDDRADPRRTRRSLGDQQRPQRLGVPRRRTWRDPRSDPTTRPAPASIASSWSHLPLRRRFCRFGRSTSITDHTRRREVAGEAGPIGAGALDPDPFDRAEPRHPRRQPRCPSGVVGNDSHPQHTAVHVDHRGDVHVAMRVHPTHHRARRYLRWSWPPLL